MSNTSLFGFDSQDVCARNAYDLCILEDEKKHAEKVQKPAVFNVLTGKFQKYDEFYGSAFETDDINEE